MPLADCEAERTGGYRARIQTPAQRGREAENPGRPCGLGDGGSRPWGFELTDGTYGQWIPETIHVALERSEARARILNVRIVDLKLIGQGSVLC